MDSNNKIREVAADVAASFVKNYKCSLDEAVDFFYDNLCKDEKVAKVINDAASAKQLSKNSLFREFLKKSKKELYYKLRKYKGDEDKKDALISGLQEAKEDTSKETKAKLLRELAEFHVSSQERFHENEKFYGQLTEVLDTAKLVVDVGCGVQPLFFPNGRYPQVEKYVALDKDKESVALMQHFKDVFKDQYHWLLPRTWNIGEGWSQVCNDYGIGSFDAALILKVVPVVKRVEPALLDELAKVPAKTIIISGVKESMVKKHDIEHKERRAINNFINASGKSITAEFDLENEFFIITS